MSSKYSGHIAAKGRDPFGQIQARKPCFSDDYGMDWHGLTKPHDLMSAVMRIEPIIHRMIDQPLSNGQQQSHAGRRGGGVEEGVLSG